MRGIFPILLTPFDNDGRIDEESLQREVEFNLAAGAVSYTHLTLPTNREV